MRRLLITGSLLFAAVDLAQAGHATLYNHPANFAPAPLPAPVFGPQSAPLVTKSGIVPPPAPPVAPSWTGVNLGVTLGAGWANTSLNAPSLGNFSGVGMYGVTGGVTAGFDYQFSPRIVAGVIAEGNLSSTNAVGALAGVGEADFREAGQWALRGRLGALTSEETLVYVTAGVSQAYTRLSFPNSGLGGLGATFTGPAFGVGVETRLDGGLYGRFEYVHAIYDKRWFLAGQLGAAPEAGLARVGLIFKPAEFFATGVSSAPPMREDWTGFYAGLQGGWGWDSTRLAGNNNAWKLDGIGGSGPIGGGLIGYERQFGVGVAALEADASASGVNSSLSAPNLNEKIAYDWDYSLRARFGRLFGNTLAFASVGWTQTYGRLTSGFGGLTAAHVFSGVQLGGGVETMLTPHIGARLEYLHSFYGKYASVLGASVDATPTAGKTRAAVVYKF